MHAPVQLTSTLSSVFSGTCRVHGRMDCSCGRLTPLLLLLPTLMLIGLAARIPVVLPQVMQSTLAQTWLPSVPRSNPLFPSPPPRLSTTLSVILLLKLSGFRSFSIILALFFQILFAYIVTTSASHICLLIPSSMIAANISRWTSTLFVSGLLLGIL